MRNESARLRHEIEAGAAELRDGDARLRESVRKVCNVVEKDDKYKECLLRELEERGVLKE